MKLVHFLFPTLSTHQNKDEKDGWKGRAPMIHHTCNFATNAKSNVYRCVVVSNKMLRELKNGGFFVEFGFEPWLF